MNFKENIGEIGFGCMKASFNMDAANRDSTIEAIHVALDKGVKFLDTSDIYAPSWNTFGHNELLIAEALRTYAGNKDGVIVATKGGITRKPGEVWGRNSSMDYLLRAAEASAGRLGVAQLDVWQHHRLDPAMPFEKQLESLVGLQERGIAKHIGVSNYSAKQLRRAVEVLGEVVSVQNQLNPAYRQELDVLEVCEEFGIAYLPWSPMKGVREVAILAEIGAELRESPFAVAVAWLRSLTPQMVVMPGVTRKESVLDALSGVELALTENQLGRINAALPETLPMDAELLSDQPRA